MNLNETVIRALGELFAAGQQMTQTPSGQATAGITPRPSLGGYMPDPAVVAAGVTQALPPPMKPSRSVPAMAPMPGGAAAPVPSPAAPPPGPMPQPLAGTPGAPQSISPLAYGGQLPAIPEGGLPQAGQESGGGFWDFLSNPEISRALLNGGMRLMAASAPSTDPRTGSLGFGLSQGLGGFQEGMDDARDQKRREQNDAINAAYKMAIASGDPGVDLQKFYTEDGLEAYGYWDAGQGRMIQIGGAKGAAGGGGRGAGGSRPASTAQAATPTDPAAPAPQTSQQQSAGVVIQDIDRAIEKIENSTLPTTGLLGGILSNVPGTEAYDIDALITTVKANAGFDRLQRMRDESPTGGALGQVSNQEIARLEATIGNLTQSQGRDQLIENLRRVRQAYNEIIHGPGAGSVAPATPPSGFVPVN